MRPPSRRPASTPATPTATPTSAASTSSYVERYPEITYRSTSVRHNRGDRWDLTGDLTVRGVTRTITIDVEFCGLVTDPWGNLRAGILDTTEIDRDDFDLTWNQALDSGGYVLGNLLL